MKKIIATIIVSWAMLLVGCVPTLHPIYTDQDIIFDESILGTWGETGSGENWTFTISDESEYKIVHQDEDGRRGEFSARLVKISGQLFLDMVPINPGYKQNEFFQERFITTHTFVHIRKTGTIASIAYLEPRWLKDLVAEKPDALRHERIGGEILVTASTRELQKFLLAHLDTKGAFSQRSELKRIKQ